MCKMTVLGTVYLIFENQLGSSTMNIDGIFINASLAVNKGEISMLSPDLCRSDRSPCPQISRSTKKGIIRFAHYGSSMADVPENEEILEIIDQMED